MYISSSHKSARYPEVGDACLFFFHQTGKLLREDLPLHKSLVIHHHQQQWTLHVSHKFSSICLLVYLLRYTMTQKKRVTGVVIVYQQLSYHYVRGHKCVGLQYVVSFMAYSSIVIAAQLWKTCQATKAVIFSSL